MTVLRKMQTITEKLIQSKLPNIFTEEDLDHLLGEPTPATRFGLVKRAIAAKEILVIRRGLYILSEQYRHEPVELFHLASRIFRPSYISLESALSAHGWIPERVITVTSCCFSRSREFITPLGRYEYRKSSLNSLAGVDYQAGDARAKRFSYLLASPLRALTDAAHDRPHITMDCAYLVSSLRIEEDQLRQLKQRDFAQLLVEKPRGAARRFLEGLQKELYR